MIWTDDIFNNKTVFKQNLYNLRDILIRILGSRKAATKWLEKHKKRLEDEYKVGMIEFIHKLDTGTLEG